MATLNPLSLLTRYKAWADGQLFASLSTLPGQTLEAKREIVFGSILRTLNHVHAMDRVWKAHLEGTPHNLTTRNPATCPAFDEIRSAQNQIDDWYIRYADGLSATQSEETVTFEFIGGGEGAMTRGEILMHVVTHTTYHRGHIADMLYELGASPPTTDMPVFLRDQRG